GLWLGLGRRRLGRFECQSFRLPTLFPHSPPVCNTFDQFHLHLGVGQIGLCLAPPRLCRWNVFPARFLLEFGQTCASRFEGCTLYSQISLQIAVVNQKELLPCLDTVACFHIHPCDHARYSTTKSDVLSFRFH